MKPSPWDASVFVPESSRIDVLVELENASGATLLKQAVGSLQYCGIATRPDCRSTSATARLGLRTAKQFFFRGCSTSFSPWRFSAIAYTLTPVHLRQRPRTPLCTLAILPLARPSSRLAIYWNPTQLPSPPGCKGAIS